MAAEALDLVAECTCVVAPCRTHLEASAAKPPVLHALGFVLAVSVVR